MVREDIIGGLKVAISRGNTLQQAMQSFYNAGYNKDEIDEAARFVMTNQPSTGMISSPTPTQQNSPPPKSIVPQNQNTQTQTISPPETVTPNTQQKISNYPTNLPRDSTKKPKKSGAKIAMIILLILILFLLIGSVVAIFFFKEQILSLFGLINALLI